MKSPVALPISTSTSPVISSSSIVETKFRQDFEVGNGREFTEDGLNSLQKIYRQLTADFNPTPATNIEAKITTSCIVDKQFISTKQQIEHETGSKNPSTSTVTIEYLMKYESRYYKMAHYPKLFRNWISNNLNVVLARMQELGIDVQSINVPTSQELEHFLLPPGIKETKKENSPSSSQSSLSSGPSPVALSVLTIGKSIGRRKREELECSCYWRRDCEQEKWRTY